MLRKRLIMSSIFSSCAIIALLLTMILLYGTVSYGWFSSSTSTNATGMRLMVSTETYGLYIDNTNEYDSVEYVGVSNLKQKLSELGKQFYDVNATSYTVPAFELYNEDVNDDLRFLVPGSYGYIRFFVKPNNDGDVLTVNFNLTLSGYKKDYTGDTFTDIIIPSDVKYLQAVDLLKGHILFFENRTITNDVRTYSNHIDGTYQFTTAGKQKYGNTDFYEVKIYWEWPLYFTDLLSGSDTTSYPNMTQYINDNPDYFFVNLRNVKTIPNIYDSVNDTYNLNVSNLTLLQQQELSSCYDEGDQLIGNNVHYLIVTLK